MDRSFSDSINVLTNFYKEFYKEFNKKILYNFHQIFLIVYFSKIATNDN